MQSFGIKEHALRIYMAKGIWFLIWWQEKISIQ